MKKSKTKKRIDLKLLAIVGGVAFLISAQLFFNYLVWNRATSDNPNVIQELVIQANDNIYREAPIDAKSGDMYIPEARLRMPKISGQGVLHYAHYEADEKAKRDEEVYLSANSWNQARAKLYIASNNGVQSTSAFFEQVPEFQACSRQFLIKFSKTGSAISTDYALVQKLTLGDARTAYLYTNQKCPIKDNNFATLYFANLQSY